MNYDLDQLWQSMVKVLDVDNKTIGSGFIIRSDGYIITCHHVIYSLDSIHVEYQSQIYEASWCESLSNIEVDIAILKINTSDARIVPIAFPKDQVVSAMVYGFPRDKIEQFSKGFDVYGILSQSPPINTLSTYKGFRDVPQTNAWNRKPREDSTFLAYRIDERVSPGISGGLVLDKETGFAIGVIQAGSGKESYAISWNNIIEKLEELSINPSAQDAFSVISLRSQQASISTSTKVSNLPSQGYRELLGRKHYIDSIVDALRDSYGRRVVSIDGLGGIGKTALAREVAENSLSQGFEEVVWLTAAIREGSEQMTFETVLDGIARQLHEPSLLKLQGETRINKTREILNSKRILIVLDNMETAKEPQNLITDKLFSILGSSKAIVTSRHRFRNIENDICSFHIGGVSKEIALQLVKDTAIEKNMPTVLEVSEDELEPIIDATGNLDAGYSPMALKFMVGQLEKYDRDEILNYVKNVRLIDSCEEPSERNEFRFFWQHIFLKSLRLLSPLDRKFMYVMTRMLEPNVGTGREDVIRASMGLTEDDFLQVRESTWRVSFLEIGHQGLRKRLYLHRLTFTFFSNIIQITR
jgi:nucleoside-triphosphatase THEP1